MTFQPLTSDQYQSALKAGFTHDQILQNEQIRKEKETPKPGLLKRIGNALTSSEQGLGKELAAGIGGNVYADTINKANQSMSDSDLAYLKAINDGRKKAVSAGQDTSHYDNLIKNFHATDGTKMTDLFPALNDTNTQVVGNSLGTLLDVLSFGSYGTAAKGAEAGKLLVKGGGVVDNLATKAGLSTIEKVAAPVVKDVVKQGIKSTLIDIGKKTAIHSAVGASVGYGYDVAQNLENGDTGASVLKPGYGTAAGATVPIAIGGFEAARAISKETAPRIINSLVKPRAADFSYGKNPGRTVSQMGITGNSMEDLAHNINTARQSVGNMIGNIYSDSVNADIRINANDEIAKIDKEMSEAAMVVKNNQGIVTTLQNVKDSLLHGHAIDAEGNIVRTSTEPRDLSSLTPDEAFNLKKEVANRTQFTGRPSDDKTVNSVLQDIYGGLKEKLNNEVGVNNPEIRHLNQQYADLTSAEIATRNRDKIIQRSNLTSLKAGGAGALGATIALLTGAATLPAAIVGVGAVALEKALETPAVKTRVAAWLTKESPNVVAQMLEKNPAIKTVLYRALPRFGSKLGVEGK